MRLGTHYIIALFILCFINWYFPEQPMGDVKAKGVFLFTRDLLIDPKTLRVALDNGTTFKTSIGMPPPPKVDFANIDVTLGLFRPRYTLIEKEEYGTVNPDFKRVALFRREGLFGKDRFVAYQEFKTQPTNQLWTGNVDDAFKGQGYGTWIINFAVQSIRAKNDKPITQEFGIYQDAEKKIHRKLGFIGGFNASGWEILFTLDGNPNPVNFSSKFVETDKPDSN